MLFGSKKVKTIKLKNGNIITKVIFNVESSIIRRIGKKKFTYYLDKFIIAFEKAFYTVATEYKGAPSAIHNCEIVKIFITEEEGPRMDRYYSIEHKVNFIYPLDYLTKESESKVISSFIHELMHVVSDIHENQKFLVRELLKYKREEEEAIIRDTNLLLKHIKAVEEFIYHNLSVTVFVDIHEMSNIYKLVIREFGSIIADMANSIIAIELKADIFFLEVIKEREELLKRLNITLADIKKRTIDYYSLIRKESKKEIPYIKALITLIEHALAIINFPVDILPYCLIKNHYQTRAKKVLVEYFNIIKSAPQEVRSRVLKYTEQMERVAIEQSRLYNPKDPNLRREIHNIDSVREVKRAYAMVRRDAHQLLMQVKKNEKLVR